MAKKRATKGSRKHRCQDCGLLKNAALFVNDPNICSKCWQKYKICRNCGHYFKKPDIIYIGNGDYACKDCADACNIEESEDD